MNSKFQLIFTALVSCALGVLGTLFFNSSQNSVKIIKSAEFSKDTVSNLKQERRPFFPTKETNTTPEEKTPDQKPYEKPAHIPDEKPDYYKVSGQMKDFEKRIEDEVGKTYRMITPQNSKYKMYSEKISGKLNNFFEEKKLWFKASVNLEDPRDVKMQFFTNFYLCGENKTKTKKLKNDDVCFITWYFVNYDHKWAYSTISSVMSYHKWKNDVPYITFNLDYLGSFARDNRLIQLALPIPEENESLQLLYFENDKFSWQDGGEIHWEESSEKEVKSFEKRIGPFLEKR